MSCPCTAKLAHDSFQACIEVVPLFFKKEIRVNSDELQVILEKAVPFVYPVLPAITPQHSGLVGFFNQCVGSFVSVFLSKRFVSEGKALRVVFGASPLASRTH